MAQPLTDTIVAPITGLGRAAVAIIRVSGSSAWQVGAAVMPSLGSNPVPRFAHYGRFISGDDGFAIPFSEGASFTGEATVELHTHGSPASVSLLISGCIEAGARAAGPGEFTMRAFMNGRLDLTQAEAVRDLVEAQTERQLRTAARQRDGELSATISGLRHRLIGALAAVEASTDFSEEVGPVDRPKWLLEIRDIRRQVQELLKGASTGRLLREGLRVAIVGRPNAGKSSLLNALLKADRALVTAIPGTTRDTIEEVVEIGGIPVHLIDTAGVRESEDAIERLGIERTQTAITDADVIWHLYDQSVGWSLDDDLISRSIGDRKYLVLASKSDLPAVGVNPGVAMNISSVEKTGLDTLRQWVTEFAGVEEVDSVPVSPRHADCLKDADDSLGEVERDLALPIPDDLLAVGLASAIRSLGEITGETTPPDVIERIFADFCIGK